MGANNDASSNTQYSTPGGPMSGGTLGYNGANINFQNPGMFTPGQLNSSAAGYTQDLSQLSSMFQNSAAGSAFNPNFYNQMQTQSANQITSSMGNQYAAAGLSGSSAEMGGMNQALQGNQMSYLKMQQGNQMQALQGLEGLDSMGFNQTMGIQNQYGNFEDAYNQSQLGLLGMQQQAQQANNSMWAGIAGSSIGAGGSVAGGALSPATTILM